MKLSMPFSKRSIRICVSVFLVAALYGGALSAQLLPVTLNSLKQNAVGLNASSGNEHTIACYPDGALTYYEYVDFTNPMDPMLTGSFVYNYQSTIVKAFDLDDRYYVEDFRQLAGTDLVVFCGYKIEVYQIGGITSHDQFGMVGWFHLNDVLTLNTVNVEYVKVDDVYNFLKIEPFYEDPHIHIAAIGQMHDNYYQYNIFHLEQVAFGNMTFQCNLYPVRIGNLLKDIVRTKSYMVFCGYDVGLGAVCMRREYYSSMSSPNELNNIYAYPYADEQGVHSLHAVYMGNKQLRSSDSIILSTLNNNYPIVSSRHRSFDIQTMSMLNAQEFAMNGKIDVIGTAYMHSAGLLGALATANPVTGIVESPVVLLRPMATTPYAADLIRDNGNYNSIDCLNYSAGGAVHMLLGGLYPWFLKNVTTPVSQFGCNEVENIEINILPKADPEQDVDVLNDSRNIDGIVKPSVVKNKDKEPDCNIEFN